jgi:hypothetical protein
VTVLDASGSVLLHMASWRPDGRSLPGRVEQGWVSRAYARKEPAPRWIVAADPMPETAVTLLLPATTDPVVEATPRPDGIQIGFEHRGVRHLVLVGHGTTFRHEGWETDAEWLWVREHGHRRDVVALDLSRLLVDGRPLLTADRLQEHFEARV